MIPNNYILTKALLQHRQLTPRKQQKEAGTNDSCCAEGDVFMKLNYQGGAPPSKILCNAMGYWQKVVVNEKYFCLAWLSLPVVTLFAAHILVCHQCSTSFFLVVVVFFFLVLHASSCLHFMIQFDWVSLSPLF